MIENRSKISHKILGEIGKAIEKLVTPGAVELLCVVGSYGDTLEDEEVLEFLQQYNDTGSCVDRIIFKVGDTPGIRRGRFKLA